MTMMIVYMRLFMCMCVCVATHTLRTVDFALTIYIVPWCIVKKVVQWIMGWKRGGGRG